MNNINLDINTYSIEELEKLLKLKPNSNYTDKDIFHAKNSLQQNILKSRMADAKKEELQIFLDNIYNKLVNNKEKIDQSKFNDVKQYDGNHFVIKNENDKYTSTLENNKQINKSIIKRTYTIDSLFRSNYNYVDNESHNYILNLPETVHKAITMSISSIEIPLSYHNISDELNNNCFTIQILDGANDICANMLITLSPGLYESRFTSLSQLKVSETASIVTAINKKISASTIPDISNCLEFKVDQISGFGAFIYDNNKATTFDLTLTDNFQIKIIFDVDNNKSFNDQLTGEEKKYCNTNLLHQKLGWMLGYRLPEIIINNSLTSTSNKFAILSRSICHINYPRYLYIAIDDFQTSSRNYFSIASESIIAPNIIARINILSLLEEKTAYKQGASPGDFLYSQKHIREYFGPTDINKLRVQLLDEYGRTFTLNNSDWSFIMTFECLYN